MTGYELRPARESDAEGICALWGGVFGDGEGFVREFLRVFGPGCGLVAVRGGSVAAMGFCPLGPEAAGYACGYIYAMATHPAHRGRGLAGEIALGLRARPSSAARTSSRRSRQPEPRGLVRRPARYAPRLPQGRRGRRLPAALAGFRRLLRRARPRHAGYALAAARPGVNLDAVTGLGWECAFD